MSEAYDAGVISGMEKVAFSVTREGHKFDAEMAKARERHGAREWELGQKYKGTGQEGKRGDLGRVLRGFQPTQDILGGIRDPRHQAYVARRHEKGKNAWNPFGGLYTPSKYEKGGNAKVYGKFKVED